MLTDFLKDNFERTYLGKEVKEFYRYHREVALEFVISSKELGSYLTALNKYESWEIKLMHHSKLLFDLIAFQEAYYFFKHENIENLVLGLSAFAFGRVIPNYMKKMAKENREEIRKATSHLIGRTLEKRSQTYTDGYTGDDGQKGEDWKKK